MLHKGIIKNFNKDGTARILTDFGELRDNVYVATNYNMYNSVEDTLCIYGYLGQQSSSPVILSIFNDKTNLNIDRDKLFTMFDPITKEIIFDYDGNNFVFRKPIKMIKNGVEEIISSNNDPVSTGGFVISVI